MAKKLSKKGKIWIFLTLALVGAGGWWFYNFLHKEVPPVQQDWIGEWKVNYFFDHEPDLVYEGMMHIFSLEPFDGTLEVFAPKAGQPEKVEIKQSAFKDNGLSLHGLLLHSTYKINGGNPTATFDLVLLKPAVFAGEGRCREFCAEGTDGIKINWTGNKINN